MSNHPIFASFAEAGKEERQRVQVAKRFPFRILAILCQVNGATSNTPVQGLGASSDGGLFSEEVCVVNNARHFRVASVAALSSRADKPMHQQRRALLRVIGALLCVVETCPRRGNKYRFVPRK